jgi:hypothetical protein
MSMVQELRERLKEFRFQEALVGAGVGWNYPPQRGAVVRDVKGRTLRFQPMAEAGGVVVYEVTEPEPPGGGRAADAAGGRNSPKGG